MILGIGVDIVETKRLAKALSRKGFIERVFTAGEIKYCKPKPNKFRHYAARFAAKEAASKALGTGIAEGIGWRDIEVTKNSGKGVSITLHNKAKTLARRKKIKRILLSISHSRNYAVAFATSKI